jgi:hypothetical protein
MEGILQNSTLPLFRPKRSGEPEFMLVWIPDQVGNDTCGFDMTVINK